MEGVVKLEDTKSREPIAGPTAIPLHTETAGQPFVFRETIYAGDWGLSWIRKTYNFKAFGREWFVKASRGESEDGTKRDTEHDHVVMGLFLFQIPPGGNSHATEFLNSARDGSEPEGPVKVLFDLFVKLPNGGPYVAWRQINETHDWRKSGLGLSNFVDIAWFAGTGGLPKHLEVGVVIYPHTTRKTRIQCIPPSALDLSGGETGPTPTRMGAMLQSNDDENADFTFCVGNERLLAHSQRILS
ncbi:hypothetical protein HK097_004139 [Rhizophlyctis rosea]|uniref:Uncharacterized protein n=1 Tax=Rhizophlyctis rosea TaxID=64517 RepID=A0AAD5X614_9FUNG|nr:hypothetical protein HK097_004139 [Rhizophlyctis rosea]